VTTVRLIVLDMDGTLLSNALKPSEGDAVRRALDKGVA
jgi:hydroxymethylpyrimidine pyrophosphatase-like HAD family hydrolase